MFSRTRVKSQSGLFKFQHSTYASHQVKHAFGACADSKGPGQTTQIHSPNQGLHCPLTELLDTIECINGEQRPR